MKNKFARKQPCLEHGKKITMICSYVDCTQKRILCSNCITEGKHISHIQYLQDIGNAEQQIRKVQLALCRTLQQIKQNMAETINKLSEFKSRIEEKYLLPMDQIKELDSSQLNDFYHQLLIYEIEQPTTQSFIEEGFQQLIKRLNQCSEQIKVAHSFSRKEEQESIHTKSTSCNPPRKKKSCSKCCLIFLIPLILIFGIQQVAKSKQNARSKYNENNLENIYSEGLNLQEKGNYEKAILQFDQVLEINPNHEDSLYYKGYSLYQLDKFNEALEQFDRVILINGISYQALVYKGKTLQKLERYDDALRTCENALIFYPKISELYQITGEILLLQNHNLDALEVSSLGLEIDPNNEKLLYNKGLALYELKRFDEANLYLDEILKKNINHFQALKLKGQSLHKLEKYSLSNIVFLTALEQVPNDFETLMNFGINLVQMGRYPDAILMSQKILSMNSNDELGLFMMGISLFEQHQYKEALFYFDKYLRINPYQEQVLFSTGFCLKELKLCSEAIVYFDRALALKQNNLKALTNKSNCLSDLGRISEYEQLQDEIYKIILNI